MADYEVKDVRTIGIFGGNGCGKTTLADALMYKAGANSRQGSVDEGNSISDTDEEEKARKGSVRTTPLNCAVAGKNLFLLDAPGYMDFWGEVVVALEVVDSVLIVVDGTGEIDTGSRRIWEEARSRNLPVAFFVNKLDRENSQFSKALAAIRDELGAPVLPVCLPGGDHSSFTTVCGLLDGKAGDTAAAGLRDQINGFREKIMEAAAETQDSLIEKYLENGTLEPAEIRDGFRAAFARGGVCPVFCGSALTAVGVDELLQSFCDLFPSPADRGEITVGDDRMSPGKDAPFCARVFKSVNDPFVGQLSYIRVWSGCLPAESEVFNSTSGHKERVSHLFVLRGKEQIKIPQAIPGYIIALTKLKETSVGDTLCAPGQSCQFPALRFPSPTALMAVYARNRGDEDKIAEGLHKLIDEDPTLKGRLDPLTKEYVLSGMGEVQIQIVVNRLSKIFNVDVELRTPRVAYKETIRGKGETKYRHKKQTGGAGQFAEVWMHVQPYTTGAENAEGKAKRELIELPWGGKLLFSDAVVGGHIPAQLVQSVKKGYLSAMGSGVLAGYPMMDVIATVYDGKTHPVDSKDIAFQIAGRQGFKECARSAQPVLMEPIMNVSITVPTEYMGAITGDLNSRRGRILGMTPDGSRQIVQAQVPMAEMLKYTPELRSLTGGKGVFTMEFERYEEVPATISQKVIALTKNEKEEEG
ncbi:MAG: elongation factor G [PVC group bacterium]